MRIGIITIHNSPNYGACIQSFALYKYLELQGYDVEVIDLHRPCYEDYVPSRRFKPFLHKKKTWKQKLRRLFSKKNSEVNSSHTEQNIHSKVKFKNFNSQIKLSQPYNSIDKLYNNPPQYDIYITGSDQVWNPTQPFSIEPYFLTFVHDKKKISYAASIGIDKLTSKEKKSFKDWLHEYDTISVREESAKSLLANIINTPIHQVSDPTFLLDVEYWQEISVTPLYNNYILVFMLQIDERMIAYGKKLSLETGKLLIVLNQTQQESDGTYVAESGAGPKEFLGYIANADMIITDSFHCTLFSIILGAKNFYTYIAPWNQRGSRITDLLTTFGLEKHLLSIDFSQSYAGLSKEVIDYARVHETFLDMQKHSRQYLNKSIIY